MLKGVLIIFCLWHYVLREAKPVFSVSVSRLFHVEVSCVVLDPRLF
jgi:hypothetical protein